MTDTDWVKPGATAVTYDAGNGWGAPTIREVTIERVTARDIVLAGEVGRRFDRKTLRERGKDRADELMSPADDRVVAAREQARIIALRVEAGTAVDQWARSRADLTKARAAVAALNAYIAASTPEEGN